MIRTSYRGMRTIRYRGSSLSPSGLRSVGAMHSRLLPLTGLLVLTAGALAGCAGFDSGPRVTEERTVGDIHAVVLDSSGDLRVTVGAEPSLTITAGESIIGRLGSEVTDGVLTLDMEDMPFGWSNPIRYELTVTSLETLTILGSGDADADFSGAVDPAVEVRGSGDVEAHGIDADSVRLTTDGSGELEVTGLKAGALTVRIGGSGGVVIDGTTDSQDVTADGSGGYDAEELRSTSARLTLTGSGDAAVRVADELDVTVDGSGSLSYLGDPAVTKRVTGSGEVGRG